MLTISYITMDYEKSQCGITHMPQFGWVLSCDKRNVMQESYELELSEYADFSVLVYQSGKVLSDASAQVAIDGVELKSVTKYFVRVRATASGEETEWATAEFVTGLMENSEWKGSFVTVETAADAENSKGTYLRKEFTLDKKIREAYVCVTALGLYKLYINGRKVGDDEMTPGWTSYRKHLCYQTYEVTEYLKTGENAIGSVLGAGWYKGYMGFSNLAKHYNHYGSRAALLAQMVVRYEDGTSECICTDTSWKGTDAPIVFSEIYDGEIYDASKEIPGWAEAGDVSGEWIPVDVEEYDFSVLCGQGAGRPANMEARAVEKIFVTPQGDTVIDFGQNLSGRIEVKACGKKGDEIRLICFESLDAKGNVYTENLRAAKQTMVYKFGKDGEITYMPSFTFMGFRYAQIVSFPGTATAENFTCYPIYSNMEHIGGYESSDSTLNQLGSNMVWGLRSNFVDVPTDCPQRDERLGWTGDAQIFCRTACLLHNTYTFYRKWMVDVAADQTPEGGVAHVVPDIISGNQGNDWLLSQGTHSAAAWADVAVIQPWVMYFSFGDKEILKLQYDSMKSWINFMRNHAEDYIWNYKLQFGDWVALDAEEGSYFGATPNDLTCTAYFAYSTRLFVKIAKILGNEQDAKEYGELYDKIVDKFQRTFFDAEGTMTAQTQTAHVVALYFELTPQEYIQKTVDNLVKLIEKENGHMVTGFVGTPYICHALSRNGRADEAYKLLMKDDFPSWLYQVKAGATTVWEHLDGIKPDGSMWSADMNSFNHYAYGAIGEWIICAAAGLKVDESGVGYKKSILHPLTGNNSGLSYLKAHTQTPYGYIESGWEIQGDHVIVKVTVPVNTTATVCLDQAKEILEADGVAFAPSKDGMEAQVGSGSYKFVFRQ